MELRQLRYFVRIVELGSVSRAAKDLYVAQPALSAQMANLESELGVRLLARSVRELDEYVQSRGKRAADLLGVAADRLASYADQDSRPGYWQTFVPPAAA